MEIGVLIYDGFDELDAIGPYEVFDYASRFADESIEVSYFTVEPRDRITASHGTVLEPDGVLPEPGSADAVDLLVVPGGGWSDRESEASAWVEAQRGVVPEAAAGYHESDAIVASVCTGGMLLSIAGITDGRRAVTHHSAIEELEATDATVVRKRVVDDGDLVTAGGVTSGIDLALHIVEREFGSEVANQIATVMEYERRSDTVGRKS